MQIFISWSGERSKYIAEALRSWLPRVLQSVKPWMSENDISVGSRWLSEVSNKLNDIKIGIICLTPENLKSPWLHFEAGALSKSLDESKICPIGFELSPGQISGPLSQFQAVSFDFNGVKKILMTLNNELGVNALPVGELNEIYSVWWPKLEEQLIAAPKGTLNIQPRKIDDQIEELLQLSREHLRRENLRLESIQARETKLDFFIDHMEKMSNSFPPFQNKFSNVIQNMQAILNENKNLDPFLPLKNSAELLHSIEQVTSAMPDLGDLMINSPELVKALKDISAEEKLRTQEMLTPVKKSKKGN